MKFSKVRKGVLLVVTAGSLALGCELIVDFDRTKIPVEGSDASIVADSSIDVSVDASQADASTVDAADLDAAEASTDDAGDADAD